MTLNRYKASRLTLFGEQTNVWVSLAIDRHEHHLRALERLDKASGDASACFCRSTQDSFLRLLTLKALFEEDTM